MGETISRILEIILGPLFIGAIFVMAGMLSYAWVANDWDFNVKDMKGFWPTIKMWVVGVIVYGIIQLIIRNEL